MSQPSRPASSIDALTSLRFFAACYVLAFHSGAGFVGTRVRLPAILNNVFLNGYLGVSFFFILSGFILAYVYRDGLLDGQSILRYSVARAGRIFPVYWLTLAVELLIKGIHGPGDIPQLFLLQSWHRIDDPMFPSANRPSWTLSVELGFYFVLPLVLFWLSKIRNLLVPIIALTIIMVAIEGPGSPSYHGYPLPQLDGIVPNVILRLPEFVLGACLGLQFVRGRRLSAGQAYGLLFASLTIIVGAVMTSQSSLNGTIAGVGFAGLIFATASANDFGPVRSVLESRVLVFLGQASFCLYILQEPVHDCLTLVTPSRLVEQLLFYPVLFAAACLIHVYFEETARKGIRRLFSLPAKAPTAP